MKNLFNFNAQAMLRPETDQDIKALFHEALREIENLHAHLDRLTADCEADAPVTA